VLRDGIAHQGIDLRFGGENHRIDFKALVGESSWLYPQTDVFTDLADARDRDGGDVRFGVSGTRVTDVTSDRPGIWYTDAEGAGHEVRCDYLAGADGSRSVCRFEIPEARRTHYFREYPFAWLGILAEAPKSAPGFDLRRQLGELESVASSAAGSSYLAEAYTGWPRR